MKKNKRLKVSVLILGFLFLLFHCSTDSDPLPEKEELVLEIVSGNGQTGLGGQLLSHPLVVRVRDLLEQPVAGLELNFQVVEGDGTVAEGESRITDADGQATASWSIGSSYNGIEVSQNSDNYHAAPVYFWAQGEDPSGIHITRTITSFRQVEGVLYEITFYGNYSSDSISPVQATDPEEEWITADSNDYHCSLFSVFGIPGQYRLGRSFDNPTGWTCLTLMTRVDPSDGYASAAPVRMKDIGFAPGVDFKTLGFETRKKLIHAIRFPPDGVNEHGLVMGLANVIPQPYVNDPNKATIHCCLWVRKVLNECRTVEEAVELTRRYNIQSSDPATLDVHAMVADATGRSIILDPADGEMKVIPSTGPFQVMTNSPVYNLPLETQIAQCPRFHLIYERLEAVSGQMDAAGCWNILQDVGNTWTEWSAVYGISGRNAGLAIDFNFNTLYHFQVQPIGQQP